MSTECASDRPPRWSSSRHSSNEAVSLASMSMTGKILDRSPGSTSEASSASRARIQFRLPLTVLISPLCAMKRYG
jgi:hypothetical protein